MDQVILEEFYGNFIGNKTIHLNVLNGKLEMQLTQTQIQVRLTLLVFFDL